MVFKRASTERAIKQNILYRITLCIGIAAMAAQACSCLFYFSLLELNRDEIIRTRCERRVAHCDGKCFMRKQIDKNEGSANARTSEIASTLPMLKFVHADDAIASLIPSCNEPLAPLALGVVSAGWQALPLHPPRS